MQPSYAELHCLSNFSFLRGASHPEELVDEAHTLGYHALALTDECSMAGTVRAHLAAKQCGLRLIIGAEFVTTPIDATPARKIVLLAQNRNGYGNLCELISLARSRTKKGTYQVFASDLGPDSFYARECVALLVGSEDTTAADVAWLSAACPGRAWLAVELLRGASHPEELVERAQTLGYTALALTDECSMAGTVRAHLAARQAGLKLIIGAEFVTAASAA